MGREAALEGLRVSLPVPPPDNHCHASGAYGRYPTAQYKAWLLIAAPLLQAALGARCPDTSSWWEVSIGVSLGSRADAQNYVKPLLDLLSGAQVDEEGQVDPVTRKRTGKGKIVKPGGLWDDDGRVRRCVLTVDCIRHPEPYVALEAYPVAEGPLDYRAAQKAAAKDLRVRAAAARLPAAPRAGRGK